MRIIAALAIIATTLAASAATAPPRVAAELYRVDGRPVPVSCLEGLSGLADDAREAPVDLRTCGDPASRPEAQADGSIGYDTPDGGYFHYAYVGRTGGVDVLSLQSSGGGTGRFTELVGVTRSGPLIRWVRSYADGDRCNGGVSGEAIADGRLTFDQAITPIDLIKLAQPTTKLEAYKDLEASAMSCVGVAHQVGDDAHWTGVSLTETDWPDRRGWTDQYRYQACFNALYRETLAEGPVELDRRGVVAFAQAFTARCMRGS